ncbi:hypothetical protein [Kitasatospora sp. SC0581]|uniref:hypothetical protein n=1 Tax=Kitasatospora sp. SC0581 TaxID=3394360 RepID=UPI003A853084
MSNRGERRAARTAEHEERIRQDQERDRRFQERSSAGAMALQRKAWARGDRTVFTHVVDVTGPDGRPVTVSLSWLGEYQGPEEGSRSEKLLNLLALVPFMEVVAAAVIGLTLLSRWLFIELTGRPHFAVTARIDGADGADWQVVARTRRRPAAMKAAAALADRVERDGAAALGAS